MPEPVSSVLGKPLPGWEEATCVVCPAQFMGPGRFDVVDRPSRDSRLDPELGYRVRRDNDQAVCVHPYRVGLPPGEYATRGEPVPDVAAPPAPSAAALEVPTRIEDLDAWLIAVARANPTAMASALARAEAIAVELFKPRDVIAAMRRVLSRELVG